METLLAANLQYIMDYSKEQFSQSKGLHIDSKDWKPYISIGSMQYYSFLTNNLVQFRTHSKISGQTYTQIIKFDNVKKMESALLILFLLGYEEKTLIDFIKGYFLNSNTRLDCTCPSELYWGEAYNQTQLNSKYGKGEHRFPKINDPECKRLVCKHMWVVLDNFDKEIEKFIKNLLPYYKRYFGITNNFKINKLRKELGEAGIRKMVATATKEINVLNNKIFVNSYNDLVNGKLNDIFKKEVTKLEDNKKEETKQQSENKEAKETENTDDNSEVKSNS